MLDVKEQLRAMFGVGATFLLASCTTLQVGSDHDASATFANYHTFTLLQREHKGIPNPLVATRVEDDIKQELQRRGYTLAADPASADFTVNFSIGAEDRINISSYPAAYAGPLWGGWGSNLDVRQYHEGTLGSTSSTHTHTGQCGTAGQRRSSLKRISSSPQSPSATP